MEVERAPKRRRRSRFGSVEPAATPAQVPPLRLRTRRVVRPVVSKGGVFGASGEESEEDVVRERPLFVGNGDNNRGSVGEDTKEEREERVEKDEGGDALEAYMEGIQALARRDLGVRGRVGVVEEDGESGEDMDDEAEDEGYLARSRKKRPVYEKVDHSSVEYADFVKDLYIEVPELAALTRAEVAAMRAKVQIRIRGVGCPRPVRSWAQCGLSTAVLEVLRRATYESPTPIQTQAIPCIMSGRDVIGVARTGSGKTLAFMLPVLRHIAMQPRAVAGEGPAALIVAPTRELAIQIFGEAKRFARAVDVRCVCAYGGSGVKDQIAELKRGADIVICTPGRMIDLLAMNSGRITNLRRVTIVVLDEADRMFDMGFEPQLTRIVENVRPDRQTVMFSATFPSKVESLARKVLKRPIQIQAGGNSVAAATIDQHVEVRSEESKFNRLLELLGTWYDIGSTLVFVDRQDNADRIFRDLSHAKYRCLSLHGGMDQADRDSAIVDFKNGDVKVLVATSVAARGLDVKNLSLVVNFDVPNHYEDYVHRVGRTGRAGKAGTAYTFITPEQDMYAADMVKALSLSARTIAEQSAPEGDKDEAQKAGDEAALAAVPEALRDLAEGFEAKRTAGEVKHGASSGYGGKGFKFDDNEEYNAAQSALRKMQAKQYGVQGDDLGDVGGATVPGAQDDVESDDDDIVAIEVAPKAGNENGLIAVGTAVSGNGSAQIPSVELSDAQIKDMLARAVKEAEAQANRQKMSADARRACIANAKAKVLSIAALQNQQAASARRSSTAGAVVTSGAPSAETQAAMEAAAAAAASISAKLGGTGETAAAVDAGGDAAALASAVEGQSKQRFAAELEINDYPQHARWQVTHKGGLADVEEFTSCVITTRGTHYPAGRNAPAGERKLHFLIEGPDKMSVKTARRDIRQKLEEAAVVSRASDNQYSKYSVI